MSKGFLLALALGMLLPGCTRPEPPVPAVPSPGTVSSVSADPYVPEGQELFCLAKTEEEAKEIAALYGIELVDFSFGVATFHTEEKPGEVIARGEKNGWPSISPNTIVTLDDPVMPG